jgi:hypothetical protein
LHFGETDDAVEIEAERPGIEGKNVNVSLNQDVLTIRGEKKMECEEQQKNHRHERSATIWLWTGQDASCPCGQSRFAARSLNPFPISKPIRCKNAAARD